MYHHKENSTYNLNIRQNTTTQKYYGPGHDTVVKVTGSHMAKYMVQVPDMKNMQICVGMHTQNHNGREKW